MKLYATITSERATKGQGGKYVDIKIYDEYKDELISIYVFKDGDDWYKAHIKTPDGATDFQELLRETKGEKEKGEVCMDLECKTGLTVPHIHKHK